MMRVGGSVAIGYLLGSLSGIYASDPPSAAWIFLSAAVVAAAAVLGCARRARVHRHTDHPSSWVIPLLSAWLLAFAHVSWVAGEWLASRVPLRDEGTRWIVQGEVVSVPVLRVNDASFDAVVRIVAPRDRAADAPRRLRIQWFGVRAAPNVGEHWQWLVEVRARPVATTVIDVERQWFRDRVHGAARVRSSAVNQRIDVASPSIDSWRARIAAAIELHVADRDALALARALSVGLTDQMTRDQWRVFAATGTTHLVAISGMHVTMFAWVAFAVARILWKFGPTSMRRVDREPFALAIGWAAAAAYAALAGLSVPTQRTLLMLGAYVAMRIAARTASMWQTYFVALLLVLLMDPLAPLAVGFWLSFVAVASILWVVGTPLLSNSRLRVMIETQIVVLLALAPLTLASFGTVSLAALVANLAAIPVISFVLVPLVLVGALASVAFPALAATTLGLAEQVYLYCWPALSSVADWSWATWIAEPHAAWYWVGALGAWVCITPFPWKLRVSGLFALLPLVLVPTQAVVPGHARIELFDTGRGVLAIVATAKHTILYDTGDSFGTEGRAGETIVREWMARWRRSRLNAIVVPRVTRDRAAGVGRFAAFASVVSVRGAGTWPGALVPFRVCADGELWSFDGVSIEQWVGHDGTQSYCGIRVSTTGPSVVLAGDFNHAAEQEWLARAAQRGAPIAAWVVLVPRRAAGTASSEQWVRALQPRVALATGIGAAGATASQRRTKERWRAAGAEVLTTSMGDRIEVELAPKLARIASRKTANAYPFLWKSEP